MNEHDRGGAPPDTELALPAPVRFLRPHAMVEALQFDGSRTSALAIAKAFPGRIALDVEHDDVLLALAHDVLGRKALHKVERGSWLVRASVIGDRVELLTDRYFRDVYVLDTRDAR